MCHAVPSTFNFFRLLWLADKELAAETKAAGCSCGGILHCANYPRKPRGCPNEFLADFKRRFSFCCNLCRRRTTSESVRFLGRRVYLALVVVLKSSRHATHSPLAALLSATLEIPIRTLQRWRQWWLKQFPLTPLWQANCASFMPPVANALFPAGLLERFVGDAEDGLMKFLEFLSPLTVGPVTICEGR